MDTYYLQLLEIAKLSQAMVGYTLCIESCCVDKPGCDYCYMHNRSFGLFVYVGYHSCVCVSAVFGLNAGWVGSWI